MIRSWLTTGRRPVVLQGLVLLLVACSESQTVSHSSTAEGSDEVSSRRYVVVNPLFACPNASDFHAKIDGLIRGDPSVPLPGRCRKLEEGTIVIEQPGLRPSVPYRGFDLEQATLVSGEVFWSDELNGDSLRKVPAGRAPAD